MCSLVCIQVLDDLLHKNIAFLCQEVNVKWFFQCGTNLFTLKPSKWSMSLDPVLTPVSKILICLIWNTLACMRPLVIAMKGISMFCLPLFWYRKHRKCLWLYMYIICIDKYKISELKIKRIADLDLKTFPYSWGQVWSLFSFLKVCMYKKQQTLSTKAIPPYSIITTQSNN